MELSVICKEEVGWQKHQLGTCIYKWKNCSYRVKSHGQRTARLPSCSLDVAHSTGELLVTYTTQDVSQIPELDQISLLDCCCFVAQQAPVPKRSFQQPANRLKSSLSSDTMSLTIFSRRGDSTKGASMT